MADEKGKDQGKDEQKAGGQGGKDEEKEYTVVDKDNDDFEIDTYTTKEQAQQRIQTLSAQGARPDRYEVKEGAKGDHEKKQKEAAEKEQKGGGKDDQKKDDKGKDDKSKGGQEKGHEGTAGQPKRY